jgi:putative membrane protein
MSEDKGPHHDHPQQYLANERTFLAWIRTSISLIGLGFIIAKFSLFIAEFKIIIQNAVDSNAVNTSLPSSKTMTDHMSVLGTGMVLLAIVLIVFALKNYIQTDKAIKTGRYQSNPTLLYMVSIVIIILSIMTIVYLSSTTT